MGTTDRDMLRGAGLTLSQVANFLGVSRQAVAKQIDQPRVFLDEQRLRAICMALLQTETPTNAHSAKTLLSLAKDNGLDIEIKGIAPPLATLWVGSPDDVKPGSPLDVREFWVFSDEPIELDTRRGGFLEFMSENIFSDSSRLAVYFVPTKAIGEELKVVFTQVESVMRHKSLEFKAHIYIIETNLVAAMPHTLVLSPGSQCVEHESESATGWVLVGRERDRMVLISEHDVKKITRCVQRCGIGQMSPRIDEFFPSSVDGEVKDTSSEIYFRKLWTK